MKKMDGTSLLIGLALVVVLATAIFWPPEKDLEESKLSLKDRILVDKYVSGQPIDPTNLSFYDPVTKRVNGAKLEEWLNRGEITQEEFDSFRGNNFRLLWQRRDVVVAEEEE